MKDAPIIILDEATSSVDPENEQALLSAIQELTKDKTLISIAHRLSTVRNADQIIVIDQGRIVQRGTHHELLQKEGIYQRFLTLRTAATDGNYSSVGLFVAHPGKKRNCSRDEKGGMLYLYLGQIL